MSSDEETVFQTSPPESQAGSTAPMPLETEGGPSLPGDLGPPELPGYRLGRVLGRGTYGQVWAGVQLGSGQEVAVKVLSREVGLDWTYLARELERLRSVSEHPSIVTLLDANLQSDPPYYVMPLLRGGSLARYAGPDQACRTSVQKVAGWLREVASALRFAHDKGLLHCDLKPSNLLLDEEGRVRLVDFGQSRMAGEAGAWGTLGYMPLDQLPGQARSPDVRWDIYALGATFYCLLTGRHPRLRPRDMQALAHSQSTRQRFADYRELLLGTPLVDPRRFNPAVDPDLAHILQGCLELDPERRTPSAGPLLEDLQRRRDRLPLWSARPWRRSYLARRWLERHWTVAIPLALVVSLISLALLWVATDPYEEVPAATLIPASVTLSGPLTQDQDATPLYSRMVRLDRLADSPGEDQVWAEERLASLAYSPASSSLLRRPAVQALLTQNAQALEIMRQAAGRTGLRLPGPPDTGWFAMLAALDVRVLAEQAQTGPAWDQGMALLALGVRMSRANWGDRSWTDQGLVGPLSLLAQLDLRELSPKALEDGLRQLEGLGRQVLRPEQVLVLVRDRTLHEVDRAWLPPDRRTWGRESGQGPGRGWEQLERAWLPLHWREYTGGIRRYYANWMNLQVETLGQRRFPELARLRARMLVGDGVPYAGLASYLHPVKLGCRWLALGEGPWVDDNFSVDSLTELLLAQARLEGLRLQVARELFRRRHGRSCDRLEELVPELLDQVPADPFRPAGPLRMQDGYIYSLGFDRLGDLLGAPLGPGRGPGRFCYQLGRPANLMLSVPPHD